MGRSRKSKTGSSGNDDAANSHSKALGKRSSGSDERDETKTPKLERVDEPDPKKSEGEDPGVQIRSRSLGRIQAVRKEEGHERSRLLKELVKQREEKKKRAEAKIQREENHEAKRERRNDKDGGGKRAQEEKKREEKERKRKEKERKREERKKKKEENKKTKQGDKSATNGRDKAGSSTVASGGSSQSSTPVGPGKNLLSTVRQSTGVKDNRSSAVGGPSCSKQGPEKTAKDRLRKNESGVNSDEIPMRPREGVLIRRAEVKGDAKETCEEDASKDVRNEANSVKGKKENTLAPDPRVAMTLQLRDAETVNCVSVMRKIGQLIREGLIKDILVVVGAGISTAAGIPDFRTPGSGLFSRLQAFNLTRPEDAFDIDCFHARPEPFFAVATEFFVKRYYPTNTHYFLKLLQVKGVLARVYTQNIDELEASAGLTTDHVVYAHGRFKVGYCVKCAKKYDRDWLRENLKRGGVPKCATAGCTGIVKPDVIFYGEKLPQRFYDLHKADFAKAQLLIVMGTSLSVQPVSNLVGYVPRGCHKLLFNKEEVDYVFLKESRGRNAGERGFYRGNSDDACEAFAEAIGWKNDLAALRLRGSRR